MGEEKPSQEPPSQAPTPIVVRPVGSASGTVPIKKAKVLLKEQQDV